ncbi:uncharacterized protein LOC141824479 [Curcuma longa]|uniref:uncharacterized protein LOC141824479 n=1 Tax=Curcuma longa TaxID=136217 RepID=UPI003D9EB5B1
MAQETLRLASSAIDHEGRLPRKYTGDGQGAVKDVSPPLEWYGVPEAARSLALVVEDVDAPAEADSPVVPWTHWVVVNIPPTARGLPEGFSSKEEAAGGEYAGIKEGHNDWKVPGWRGPKPPTSGHRISFKLYALDQPLHLGNKVTKEKLQDSMEGHVVGEAELIAIF